MKCPNCNAEVLFTVAGKCKGCENIKPAAPKKKKPVKQSETEKRRKWVGEYRRKIMADPVRREKYLAYQAEYRAKRRKAKALTQKED